MNPRSGVVAIGVWLAWMVLAAQVRGDRTVTDPFARAVDVARARVVKIYGAQIGREPGYTSGVLVSADGRVVTVSALLLEGRGLRVVLSDGRTLPARVTARDERRQLAMLKVEALGLPYFELGDSGDLQAGDWVLAAANPFKVAEGPEPVSVSVGVFAGRTNLAARRRAQDFPYDGPVLLTDVLTTAPGSAGGALVDLDGRLVGVIGKRVHSRHTNTWVNYAMPVEQVAAFVAGDRGGIEPAEDGRDAAPQEVLTALGLRLMDYGARLRPAYIERVRADSPAARAGVRPNDLIVSVNGQTVASCADCHEALTRIEPDRPIELVVKRGDELVVVSLMTEELQP